MRSDLGLNPLLVCYQGTVMMKRDSWGYGIRIHVRGAILGFREDEAAKAFIPKDVFIHQQRKLPNSN
jgi:hypothetical protein